VDYFYKFCADGSCDIICTRCFLKIGSGPEARTAREQADLHICRAPRETVAGNEGNLPGYLVTEATRERILRWVDGLLATASRVWNCGDSGSLWTMEVWISVKPDFEHGFEFGFAEAEPLVGVEFAGFFEAVLDQVEDDDAAAGDEDAVGFADGAVGVQGVVQGLREEDEVDGGVVDGQLFHVALAVLDVF
jgi:hypothetical protein